MKKLNITYFDLETTGVSTKNDKIVSIYLFNKKKKYEISTVLNPEVEIPKGASDVHGITNDMVTEAYTLSDISDSIVDIFNKSDYICGYNISNFDIPMLLNNLKSLNIDMDLSSKKIIDLYYIVKRVITDEEKEELGNLKLETVYNKLFDDSLDSHLATADTKACIDILEYMDKSNISWEEHLMTINDVRGQKINDINHIIKFGKKHIGKTVQDVLNTDPSYIKFCTSRNLLSFNDNITNIINQTLNT